MFFVLENALEDTLRVFKLDEMGWSRGITGSMKKSMAETLRNAHSITIECG